MSKVSQKIDNNQKQKKKITCFNRQILFQDVDHYENPIKSKKKGVSLEHTRPWFYT
jgi:hypothetical protein